MFEQIDEPSSKNQYIGNTGTLSFELRASLDGVQFSYNFVHLASCHGELPTGMTALLDGEHGETHIFLIG